MPVVKPTSPKTIFEKAADNHGIDFVHKEDEFSDFDRERMVFQMHSTDGPRMAKVDVNGGWTGRSLHLWC